MGDYYPSQSPAASSRLEALLSMASGSVAQPASGFAGLYGLLTGGASQGAQNVARTQQALTYAPRDPSSLQALGNAVAPVTSRYDQLRQYLGNQAQSHGAGPALSTAAYMVPDTLMSLIGARGMGAKGPGLAQIVDRSAAPTGMARQVGSIGAWHASPHDFNKFNFSDNMGAGEGAQAYGHGGYFAGSKSVGDIYYDTFAAKHGRAKMYNVDLAPNEHDLLNWDAPLHQQTPGIQQALSDFGWAQDDMTGGEFYRALAHDYSASPAEASQRLQDAGIPGIHYLDGNSRGAGDGTRNYVMFDDKNVTIKGKQ